MRLASVAPAKSRAAALLAGTRPRMSGWTQKRVPVNLHPPRRGTPTAPSPRITAGVMEGKGVDACSRLVIHAAISRAARRIPESP
jgi:hypothetical protein